MEKDTNDETIQLPWWKWWLVGFGTGFSVGGLLIGAIIVVNCLNG